VVETEAEKAGKRGLKWFFPSAHSYSTLFIQDHHAAWFSCMSVEAKILSGSSHIECKFKKYGSV
jgi:hypothetical protein